MACDGLGPPPGWQDRTRPSFADERCSIFHAGAGRGQGAELASLSRQVSDSPVRRSRSGDPRLHRLGRRVRPPRHDGRARAVAARARRIPGVGLDQSRAAEPDPCFPGPQQRPDRLRILLCGSAARYGDNEIDVVALAGRSRIPVLVGEAKWTREVSAPRIVADLYRKAAALPGSPHDLRVLVCARERVTHLPDEALAITAGRHLCVTREGCAGCGSHALSAGSSVPRHPIRGRK